MKDYINLTREESGAAEKRLKGQKTTTALIIGVVIGVAVWAATHQGFVLPVILLLVAYGIGYQQAQNLKSIQAEISRRNTVVEGASGRDDASQ